jgi:predicted ferric reductase
MRKFVYELFIFLKLFWITHKLYILIYVALVLHCLNFWKWFIVPLILVLYENVSNFFRSRSSLVGKTNLTQVTLFDSKVTKLVISRPSHFQFRSGDYIFIKLPAIARSEWHPFTISSAPEQKNEICLHVRSLGNWTNKLYDYFSNYSNNFPNASFAHPYLNMSKYGNYKFEKSVFNDLQLI